MTDAAFACPACGSTRVETSWCPRSYSLRCAACGWAVATSRFPPIFDDPIVYRIFLVPGGSDRLRAVQAIKTNCGGTSVGVKQRLAEPRVYLFEGTAVRVFRRIENLKSDGFVLEIEPSFPYRSEDLRGMNLA
jgi:hypothetical protein